MKKMINLANGASAIAHNRCTQCGREWQDKPMGFARHIICPKCGGEYWEWINHSNDGTLDAIGFRVPVFDD